MEFNRQFNCSFGIILGGNLGDKLPNVSGLELLFLLLIALVSLLRSQERNKTAFFAQKNGVLGFDSYRKLFLPGIPSLILLSIFALGNPYKD